jgi:hypothetical protein
VIIGACGLISCNREIVHKVQIQMFNEVEFAAVNEVCTQWIQSDAGKQNS